MPTHIQKLREMLARLVLRHVADGVFSIYCCVADGFGQMCGAASCATLDS
jgi:hypothetical protein